MLYASLKTPSNQQASVLRVRDGIGEGGKVVVVHLRLVDYTLAEKEMAAAATASVSATASAAAAASASLPPHTLPSGGTPYAPCPVRMCGIY